MRTAHPTNLDSAVSQLWPQMQEWAAELGFSHIVSSAVQLAHAKSGLQAWLDAGYHGQMQYMLKHQLERANAQYIMPSALSVLSLRMPYLHQHFVDLKHHELEHSAQPSKGHVSLYARGRDYHKVLRKQLQSLGQKIRMALPSELAPQLEFRACTDSAPVLEVEHHVYAGAAWRGKHTLALTREGSFFFLGELLLNCQLTPLPPSNTKQAAATLRPLHDAHCGTCQRCIDVCPTQAIVAPFKLDARRCISYLTIEHSGSIPIELRRAMGNRIYGCDDCQTHCPWNQFATKSLQPDFQTRDVWFGKNLIDYIAWSEDDFIHHTTGSPIRRIGYERWLRNLAVALGNALSEAQEPDHITSLTSALLQRRATSTNLMVLEHIDWALLQHTDII